MELSWSTGVGKKEEPTQKAVAAEHLIQEAHLEDLGGTPVQKEPSPWSCFYCSADVKVSEDAIKALKSKERKDSDGETSNTNFHNYQQRKTLGQGLMDLALLTANVNQLRSLLDASTRHPYFYANLTFIGISIFFQVVVGIALILNSRVNVNEDADVGSCSKVNNFTFACIFIITVINVFLSVFYEDK